MVSDGITLEKIISYHNTICNTTNIHSRITEGNIWVLINNKNLKDPNAEIIRIKNYIAMS